jgi:hypothetical protein
LYHRYLGNLDDEELMQHFARSLGFQFRAAWAFFMPLEKILAYLDNDPELATITEEDLQLMAPASNSATRSKCHRQRI